MALVVLGILFAGMLMFHSEYDLLQRVIRKLVDEYGYSLNQVGFEVQVSDRLIADCLIYTDETKSTPFIIIEVKSPLHYPLGVDQLASYMLLSGAQYGMLTDGVEKFCFRLVGKEIMEISDVPRKSEKEAEILRKQELKPATRLDYKLQKIYDSVWRSERLSPESALEEMEKLILCKLEDEKSRDEIPFFWISPSEAEEIGRKDIQKAVMDRMKRLFYKVKKRHPRLYPKGENLKLSLHTLCDCVAQLQNYSLSKASYDVISTAYPKFISKSTYGFLGQYFTPKPLVDFITKLLDPTEKEKVLDPACGSGGFLISIVHYVSARAKKRAEHARKKIFGIDINPKMVSICKTNMLIQGDGHAHVFLADFLSDLSALNGIKPESFDIVVTDPPLAHVITDQKVLQNFELGIGKKSQQIYVLFLEKCVDMTKPKGRIAMIVPDPLLTRPSLNYARDFLLENTLIRAIISLPARTFVPYSGIKASVILMQKKERTRRYEDYDVFMATAPDASEETIDKIARDYRRSVQDA